VLDRRVRVRELPIELAHDGEERRDHRAQAARQGQGPGREGISKPVAIQASER
jgi:hypothetical protein